MGMTEWAYVFVFTAFGLMWTAAFAVGCVALIRAFALIRALTDQLLAFKNPWVHQAYLQQSAQREAAASGQGHPEEPEYEDDALA